MVIVVVNPWKGKYGGFVSEIIGYNNKKQKHNANLMKNNKLFTFLYQFDFVPPSYIIPSSKQVEFNLLPALGKRYNSGVYLESM